MPADNPERAAGRARAACASCTAPSCWPRSPGAAPHRRGRDARQDDDVLDGRPRAARLRPRPGLPDRRRAADDRHQRGVGRGRVARRRGRRVRPVVPAPDAGDRRRDERRARPPHDVRPRARTCDEAFRAFLAARRHAVVWDRPECSRCAGGPRRVDVRRPGRRPASPRAPRFALATGRRSALAVPGAHNALNAAAALEALRARGGRRGRAPPRRWRASGARAGASRSWGAPPRGAIVVDDYAHHPTEVAATIAAARTLAPAAGGRGLPAPPVLAHARARARVRRRARAADVAVVLDVYPARERAEDFPGVERPDAGRGDGRRRRRPPVLWLPAFDDAERALRGLLGDGDLLLVMGAGDVDALGRRLVGGLDPRGRAVAAGSGPAPSNALVDAALARPAPADARRAAPAPARRASSSSRSPSPPCSVGGWLWLRDSSLVAVHQVTVTGASGPQGARIARRAARRPHAT